MIVLDSCRSYILLISILMGMPPEHVCVLLWYRTTSCAGINSTHCA